MPPTTFHEALEQGDRRWIESRLASERPSPEVLRELFNGADSAVVHAALAHLVRRLERLEGDDTAPRLLDALPATLGACMRETELLLAEAATLLPAAIPTSRLSRLVSADSEPDRDGPVAIAWLRAEALRDPSAFAARAPDERMRQAAATAKPERALDPEAFVRALCASADGIIQRTGIDHLGAVAPGALAPLPVLIAILTGLLDSPHPRSALAAAVLLGEPWTAAPGLPDAVPRLRALLSGPEKVALAALSTLAVRGEAGLLRLTLEDPRRPPPMRRRAMELLHPFAGQGDLQAAIHVALEDPLFHGEACAALLLTSYRRGVRCDAEDVPRVCALYTENHDIETAVVAEVLSQRAGDVAAAAGALALTDPSLPRLVELLGALDMPASTALLRDLLARPEARPLRGDVMEALARIEPGGPDAVGVEEEVLAQFEDEPWSAIRALRRLGSARTLSFLRALDGRVEAPWSTAARDLLFALEDDPARALPDAHDREPTPATLACLHPVLDERGCEELARIARESGHPLQVQAVTQLGRAATRRAGAPLGELLVDVDEDVRSQAQAALRALGAMLFERGRIRPVCLLDATSAAKAGELLLADALLVEIARPGRSDAQIERLLEQLVGLQYPTAARRVRRLLRHGSVGVEKLALECLARGSDPRALAWIVPFAAAEDIYRLRQALAGIGNLGAGWATPALLVGLEHPNMNIKKTAAEALARTGAAWPPAIAAIQRWLGAHDNPGFREALLGALAKNGNAATLVDALERARSDRERRLLVEALSGKLSPAAVAGIVRRGARGAQALLEALFGDEIALAAGTLRDLEAELRRSGVEDKIPTRLPDRVRQKFLRGHRVDEDLGRLEDLLSAPPGDDGEDELGRLLGELASMGLSNSRAALLKKHAGAIEGLLDRPEAGLRSAAVAALSALTPHLSGLERISALGRTRSVLAAGRLPPEEAISLIERLGGVPSIEEARLALALPRPDLQRWGASRLAQGGKLADDEALRLRSSGWSRELLTFLVVHALRAGSGERVLEAALSGSDLELMSALSTSWGAHSPERDLVDRLAVSAQRARSEIIAPIVRWIARIGGEASRAALRDLSRSRNAELSDRAIRELGRPTSSEDRVLLVELLSHERRETRSLAARALAERGEPHARADVLARYLAAELGADPPEIDLGLTEVATIVASLDPGSELGRERAIDLLRVSPRLPRVAAARVQALLRIWELDGDRSAPRARAALCEVPAHQLLPFLMPRLRDGSTAALDLLGESRRLSPELFALFQKAGEHGRGHFFAMLRRWSSAGRIDAPDLAAYLLACIGEGHPDRGAALAILPRLAAWGRPDEGRELGEALLGQVNRSGDEAAFATLLESAERLPPESRVGLLGRVRSAALFDRVLAAVVPLVIEDASLEGALPSLLRARFERERDRLAWEERDLSALSAVARRPTPNLADRLAELLCDPSPGVRIHVHRLLRPLVSRERYLDLTRMLIDDPNPGLAVRAIRTVAFGGQVAAAADLAGRLHDRRNAIAKAAREGLLAMGEAALPALRAEMGRARPDRRSMIAEVIAEIGAREEGD
jgi:hypothetical protein